MEFLHFATPWYLLGLLSLAVPFLLLFTKANPSRTVNFSSIEFLSVMSDKAAAVLEWKRLLLLIIRLFILLLLAFAFALPFIKQGASFLFFKPNKHLVFVLDNSYSMGYSDEAGETLLDKAKKGIEKIVEQNRQTGISFSLYLFNQRLVPVVADTDEADVLLREVSAQEISNAGSHFLNLIPELEQHFKKLRTKNYEIIFFSDFSLPAEAEEKFNQDWQELNRIYSLRAASVQPGKYQNFAIEKLEFPGRPFMPEAPETIKVHYRNYGYSPGTVMRIELWMDQNIVDTQSVTISGPEGTAVFKVSFPNRGTFRIRAKSQDDRLNQDNESHRIAVVQGPLRLLLLQDRESEYPFDSPYFYFTKALQSFEDSGALSWIQIESLSLSNLGNVAFEDYDLVLLADLSDLDPKTVTRLQYYLKSGGSVLLAVGDHFDFARHTQNTYLVKLLGGYFSQPLAGEEKPFHLQHMDTRQPVLSLFEEKTKAFEKINFTKIAPFMPVQGEGQLKVLLWFEGDWPALMERHVEEGRIFIWASSLNDAWTDFPQNPFYLPFFFEFVKYATFPEILENQNAYWIGDSLEFSDNMQGQPYQVVINQPDNQQLRWEQLPGSGAKKFYFDSRGIYEWARVDTGNNLEKGIVAVNVNPSESQVHYVRVHQQDLSGEESPAAGEGKETLLEQFHHPKQFFYRPLFCLVFGLLILEAWIANRFYRPEWV